MKPVIGWTLGITAWVAVTFAIYLACATLNARSCDPDRHCDNVSGPGPGNGR